MSRVDHARVHEMAASDQFTDAEIGAAVGCSPGYARLIRSGAIKRRGEGGSALSRKEPKTLAGRSAQLLAFDNTAFMEARTLYPSTVISPGSDRVLKSGFNSAKIGARIMKGRWKDYPVYTLTLEERATCPKTCKHWRSCFGNGMQQARRYRHGPELEQQIEQEVAALSRAHPRGFAIRLHVLGDFYSIAYVEMWARLIDKHPQLHAFGFSARWEYNTDPIAKALIDLVQKRWSRFAIRFSNAPIDELATVSIEHPFQKPADAILCPQQMGQTAACSTCALCWQSTRRIAFIQH